MSFAEGSEIPDPNFDVAFRAFSPDHVTPVGYSSPLTMTVPCREPSLPVSPLADPSHPMSFLFPGSPPATFSRYLGAPIGTDAPQILGFISKRLVHALSLHDKLPDISTRAAYHLLRNVSLPRALFLPSVTHPDLIESFATEFDARTDAAWASLCGAHSLSPTALAFVQALRTLPVSKGGSSVPRVRDVAPASLFASVQACLPLLKKHEPAVADHLVASLSTTDPLGVSAAFSECKRVQTELANLLVPSIVLPKGAPPRRVTPPTALPGSAVEALTSRIRFTDKRLANNVHSLTWVKLHASVADVRADLPRAPAALVGQNGRYAGAWLSLPSPVVCLLRKPDRPHNDLYTTAYRIWTLTLPDPSFACRHVYADRRGRSKVSHPRADIDHLLGCSLSGEITIRHDSITDVVRDAGREAGSSSVLEPHLPPTRRDPGVLEWHEHRADIMLQSMYGTKDYYDVTVAHSRCDAKGVPPRPGARMDAAYKRKASHYARIVAEYLDDPMTITPWPLAAPVVPLAIESYGAMSREVVTLVQHLASNYESSCTSGHAPGARTLFLAKYFRRLSTALWLGNAAAVHWATKGGRPAHLRVPGRATGSRSLGKLAPQSAPPSPSASMAVPPGLLPRASCVSPLPGSPSAALTDVPWRFVSGASPSALSPCCSPSRSLSCSLSPSSPLYL